MAIGDVLHKTGTPIVWTDTGGDEVLDLGTANGNAGAVCVGAYHDFGVSPRPFDYGLTIFIDGFDTNPAVNAVVYLYISEGNSVTVFTGPESPSDTTSGAGSTARLPNLMGPFPVVVHSTTAGNKLVGAFEFRSPRRYLAPVVHNATAQKLLSTSDAHLITITPIYPFAAQS